MEYADVVSLKSVSQSAAERYLKIGWVIVTASYNEDQEDRRKEWTLLIGWPRELGERRDR